MSCGKVASHLIGMHMESLFKSLHPPGPLDRENNECDSCSTRSKQLDCLLKLPFLKVPFLKLSEIIDLIHGWNLTSFIYTTLGSRKFWMGFGVKRKLY